MNQAGDVAVRPSVAGAVGRGLLGWAVLGVALGLVLGVFELLDQNVDLPSWVAQALRPVLLSLLVVPTIILLRRRLDRADLAGLGWSHGLVGRELVRPAWIGLVVGIATGVVVWGVIGLLGLVRVESVDVPRFLLFLVANGVVLLLLEALPEEFALRGYAWTNLRDGCGPVVATIVVTLLFPLTTGLATAVAHGLTSLPGATPLPWQLISGNPVIYVVQILLIGLVFVAARTLPIPGALAAAMAFHWSYLTVTRTMTATPGSFWLDTGWQVTGAKPVLLTAILVHGALGGACFLLLRRRWAGRPGTDG